MNSRLQLLEDMLRKEPHDSFLNYAIALEFKKKGDISRAIGLMEKLIGRDPAYLAAYYQLGKLYEVQADKEKALNIYRKGITVAQAQKNIKTLSELNEAIELLEE